MSLKKQSWNHDVFEKCPRCDVAMWWNGYWPCGGTIDCDCYICPECGHEFGEQLAKKELLDYGETRDDRFRITP